ncbi:MAG: C4-type zinc ribbon domain-containing protein [Saprospiraceae bacterium]|nr:C4-type zinc ribbon domain-containing protein [Saprospiraceae bacterium]
MAKAKQKKSNIPVEEKLANMYTLQLINTEMDELQTKKGELPMEVQDLEDSIEGLSHRIEKMEGERRDLELKVARFNGQIKESESLIERYDKQQANVKNNREYDALTREIELQKLDIQLAQKRIRETRVHLGNKELTIEATKKKYEIKTKELERKRVELEKIITKTEKDERKLQRKEKSARKKIEDSLLATYDRVRGAYRNGLAVVTIKRDACGGCHKQIPAQIQLELVQNKRIITCEHCGRILVDAHILEEDKGEETEGAETKA